MKAIVQDRYGSADVLQLREVDDPTPGPSEVRVRIAAASVNAADWHILRGDPKLARLADHRTFGPIAPRQPIRGRDFAGRVDAVGAAVTRWTPGPMAPSPNWSVSRSPSSQPSRQRSPSRKRPRCRWPASRP
jgi:NADPH:quinone reductase-like Zn-dependent oxidoreductase